MADAKKDDEGKAERTTKASTRYFKIGPNKGRGMLFDGEMHYADRATGVLETDNPKFAEALLELGKTDSIEEIDKAEADELARDAGPVDDSDRRSRARQGMKSTK